MHENLTQADHDAAAKAHADGRHDTVPAHFVDLCRGCATTVYGVAAVYLEDHAADEEG